MAEESILPDELLQAVENYLDITWKDEATDKKIGGLVSSGIAYLNRKLGCTEAAYLKDGMEHQLLFDFVRYARDGAMDIFESNYLSLILSEQNHRRVEAHAEKNADTS